MATDARAEHLDYYLRELEALRAEGAAFARRHPRVAGALELGPQGSADPNVERMIEAFAFLTARLQRTIHHQHPRIAHALLETLYPHLAAPVPTLAIAEFRVDPARARAAHGFVVERGTQLVAPTDDGAVCRFRTASRVELWPIDVDAADRPDPALFPFLDGRSDVGALLRVRLRALGGESFADMLPDALRFHLGGSFSAATQIHETLHRHVREVWAVFAAPDGGDAPTLEDRLPDRARRLGAGALRAVGFEPEDALLPHPAHAHQGHRLIQEYFALPEKFLFTEISGLRGAAGLAAGRWLDLVFVLDEPGRAPAGAEREAFRLGGAPVVNLFNRVSEPIRIDRTRSEYRLEPDLRQERSTEVHSISQVTLASESARDGALAQPFFSYAHAEAGRPDAVYWVARRSPTLRPDKRGGEIDIAFCDSAFDPRAPGAQVAFAHCLCTNRGLAERLPVGARFGLEVEAPVLAVICATKPTPQIDPPPVGADLWRLISHLSLNRLSFVEGPEAGAALREALTLYSAANDASARRQIEGVVDVAAARVARRMGEDAWRGWVRGFEVRLTLAEENFAGGSGYLFGSVLSRFFGLYAGAGGFAELAIESRSRDREWARWPARSGEAILA